MKLVKKHLALLLAITMVIGAMTLPTLAAGDGEGGGTGEGHKDEIFVEVTDPVDGGSIDVDGSIEFKFNKNVAGAHLVGKNRDLFKLQDENGNDVAFEIEVDSEDRNRRWHYIINPVNDLVGGKTYTATALAGIEANNGNVSVRDFPISFYVNIPPAKPTITTESLKDR